MEIIGFAAVVAVAVAGAVWLNKRLNRVEQAERREMDRRVKSTR